MKNVAELNKELPRQQSQEIRKLTRSTQELRKEFGINKSSRTDFSYENEPLIHKRKRDDLNEFSELSLENFLPSFATLEQIVAECELDTGVDEISTVEPHQSSIHITTITREKNKGKVVV